MKLNRILGSLFISIATISISFTSFSETMFTGSADIDGVTKRINTNWFYVSSLPSNTKDFITATVTADWGDNDKTTYNYVYKHIEPTYPIWRIRDNGYYYYLTSNTQSLKNTTTPDGYKVDSLGRWIDDSGNPISASIGNDFLNTKEKYAQKTDSEIKDIQISQLRSLIQNSCNSYDDVKGYLEYTTDEFSEHTVETNNSVITWNYSDYNLGLPNNTGFVKVYVNSLSEVTPVNEKTLRIMFGDELGYDINQYIRSIENTNNNDDCAGCAVRDFENKFDVNKFKGRVTDYGKTILDVTLDPITYGATFYLN